MVCLLTVLVNATGEILFRWVPDRSKVLKEFWEDYALVMETLEENQVEKSHQTHRRLTGSYAAV